MAPTTDLLNPIKMKRNEKRDESEILKAVAQAWHAHSGSSKAAADTSEFETRRMYFKGKPSRFKLEAMRRATKRDECWDFAQSLWDSYEIISVSKKLEAGMLLEHPFSDPPTRKESNNSLRNLFNKMSSSTRFT
ncbi:uncharacterized protein LOC131019697 [Salvia miltiorrhiza]|uniref:uncharacterized protein LOC131019697 n=1 Tax=Salvia miltiorrhiza TaxID=226208 RepID=UPI0025AC6CCA|nr:uncharacterized protein LOC131019697 [Salvia miltiorrhiza]